MGRCALYALRIDVYSNYLQTQWRHKLVSIACKHSEQFKQFTFYHLKKLISHFSLRCAQRSLDTPPPVSTQGKNFLLPSLSHSMQTPVMFPWRVDHLPGILLTLLTCLIISPGRTTQVPTPPHDTAGRMTHPPTPIYVTTALHYCVCVCVGTLRIPC